MEALSLTDNVTSDVRKQGVDKGGRGGKSKKITGREIAYSEDVTMLCTHRAICAATASDIVQSDEKQDAFHLSYTTMSVVLHRVDRTVRDLLQISGVRRECGTYNIVLAMIKESQKRNEAKSLALSRCEGRKEDNERAQRTKGVTSVEELG